MSPIPDSKTAHNLKEKVAEDPVLFEEKREWIQVSGKDMPRFLSGMWTSDLGRALNRVVENLTPLAGPSLLLNVKGKIISKGIFLIQEPSSCLFSLPVGTSQQTLETLNHYIVADDVEVKSLDAKQAPFLSVFVLPFGVTADDQDQPGIDFGMGARKDKIFEAKKFSSGFEIPRNQFSVRHRELWFTTKEAASDWQKNSGLSALDAEQIDNLRIEKGVPKWGIDFGAETLPLEFPLFDAISFSKGCYIGQEVIARATYRGRMTRAFCSFESLNGEELIQDYIFHANNFETPIGKITTCVQNRGLGLVRLSAVEKPAEIFQKNEDGHFPLKVIKNFVS